MQQPLETISPLQSDFHRMMLGGFRDTSGTWRKPVIYVPEYPARDMTGQHTVIEHGGVSAGGYALNHSPSRAMGFDGADGYVDVGALGSFFSDTGDAFSVACRFRTTSTAGQELFGVVNDASTLLCLVNMGVAGVGKLRINLRNGNSPINQRSDDTVGSFNTGLWHDLLLVFRKENAAHSCFIDGEQVATTNHADNGALGTLFDATRPVAIGALNNIGTLIRYWDGDIAAFAIYHGDLSAHAERIHLAAIHGVQA